LLNIVILIIEWLHILNPISVPLLAWYRRIPRGKAVVAAADSVSSPVLHKSVSVAPSVLARAPETSYVASLGRFVSAIWIQEDPTFFTFCRRAARTSHALFAEAPQMEMENV